MTSLHFEQKGTRTKCREWGIVKPDGAGLRSERGLTAAVKSFYALALMISINSGLREAPPTRKPSTSFWLASSLQVAPVTEPEKKRFMTLKERKMRTQKLYLITMTDLRRWSSQSSRQPQKHESSATPSACCEPPEPAFHQEICYMKTVLITSIYLLCTCYLPAVVKRSCLCQWPKQAHKRAPLCSSPLHCLKETCDKARICISQDLWYTLHSSLHKQS